MLLYSVVRGACVKRIVSNCLPLTPTHVSRIVKLDEFYFCHIANYPPTHTYTLHKMPREKNPSHAPPVKLLWDPANWDYIYKRTGTTLSESQARIYVLDENNDPIALAARMQGLLPPPPLIGVGALQNDIIELRRKSVPTAALTLPALAASHARFGRATSATTT